MVAMSSERSKSCLRAEIGINRVSAPLSMANSNALPSFRQWEMQVTDSRLRFGAEDFLKSIVGAVLEERSDDMQFFAQRIDKEAILRLETLAGSTFERMDYSEAIKILENCGESFEFPVQWGLDLQSEHERFLTEKHVNGPVVVVNYPKDIKAFYMRLNDDDKTVAAMDVLVPGVGEIIGGSQREERLDVLDSRLEGPLAEELWWYRDLRRYGTVPHSGFGLGLERLVLYVTTG